MHQLTLDQIQETVDRWIKTVGVRYFSELTNLSQLVEEVGEVARLMSRTYGEQSFKAGSEMTPEQANDALADELADVMFVLVCIANQTGVNLSEAFHRNLEKKSIRDVDRHSNNSKLC